MSRSIPAQCIGIIFESVATKRKSGHRIFESFVEENRSCFWNIALVDAVSSLEYVGFMRPGTLFITASQERHLATLRSAWARRLLKPAKGFRIISLGDIGGIQIHEVEQLRFVPLADMLCDAIARLNRLGHPATFDTVRAEIADECPTMAAPPIEMFHRALQTLINSGLVYRMSEHLFVSIPAAAPYHTANVPPPPPKCTVECQTGKSIIESPDTIYKQSVTTKQRKGLFARLFAKKESSPAKVAPKQKEPITFSAQFPPPEWICNPALIDTDAECFKQNVMPTQRFCTFAEHLCDELSEKKRNSHRFKQRRGERHLSSSSECLNYGPIDPPECLPHFADAELVDDLRKRRYRRGGGAVLERRRDVVSQCNTKQHHHCTTVEHNLVQQQQQTQTQNPHKQLREQNWMPTDGMSSVRARTSTPLAIRGSDSAYSLSPVVTELSSSLHSSLIAQRRGSWSGSELIAGARDSVHRNEHTYVNVRDEESTQFEEITQLERLIPSGTRAVVSETAQRAANAVRSCAA
ncbi:Storkhead-box protein 1 [Toxocara canis]|uniref:Storkhead-box protein 1 n=2 Tax=Toxocara canis TaxID=6265 RepID=A0A0B2V813_TOXCA|nr:Storkhead-box protein 1 [Toxocara canis]VDM38415.1 unnamed protein product [Toxocara canis]